MSARQVVAEVPFDILTMQGSKVMAEGRLVFDRSEPYEIVLIVNEGESAVVWRFSRSLLTLGLSAGEQEPHGDGDVRVWCDGKEPADGVHIALISSEGRATVTVPLGAVRQFLGESYALVPAGMENVEYDLDAEIAMLLRDDEP